MMGDVELRRRLKVMGRSERIEAMCDHLMECGSMDVSEVPGADVDAVIAALEFDGVTVLEVRSGMGGYWLEVAGCGR